MYSRTIRQPRDHVTVLLVAKSDTLRLNREDNHCFQIRMAASSSALFTGKIAAFDIGFSTCEVKVAKVLNGELSESRMHESRKISSSLLYDPECGSFPDEIQGYEMPSRYFLACCLQVAKRLFVRA